MDVRQWQARSRAVQETTLTPEMLTPGRHLDLIRHEAGEAVPIQGLLVGHPVVFFGRIRI